jgi:N-methylhydantoinase A
VQIGVDIGGTFTDIVALDGSGRLALTKVPSTPKDLLDGIASATTKVLALAGARPGEVERFIHGTTIATNAILEQKGATTGVLTTEGFEDVLEMGRMKRSRMYDLAMDPEVPTFLAPRRRRLGIRERLDAKGRVLMPLHEDDVRQAVATLRAQGVAAIAVCYLFSFLNPAHERRTREIIAELAPDVSVSLSSEVDPTFREYERSCVTAFDAYLGPVVKRYLAGLAETLRGLGVPGVPLIMRSRGGIVSAALAAQQPVTLFLSGPAGGVIGAAFAAERSGVANFVSLDMGGTSNDVALVREGRPLLISEGAIGPFPVRTPMVDVNTIGAGGGSIAWIDAAGGLRVGPRSAGAEPGPACYGKGGTAATVTDANLVLGYLDPGNFLGGRTLLDLGAAQTAVDEIAERLGTDRMTAAEGIHRVINTVMAEGIRVVSVRRGVDPRRFALLAFGGAAALHVTDVARRLEIGRVIVPRVAAVLSAWGMLATDLRYETVRSHIGDARRIGADELRQVFAEMEDEGRRRLAEAFSGRVRVQRAVDMRYGEQIFEVNVPLDGVDLEAPEAMTEIVARFHKRHEELYTYATPDQEVVLVNARLAVVGELPALPEEPALATRAPAAPRQRRRVYLDGWREVPVYDLDGLAPGQTVAGPALVEAATTTALLRAGERATVTPLGWLDVRL